MNLGFGAPWLLWGAALVGVPLLIHLLNRRRFVVVSFAALRFLQDAYRQRRRRLRMENLLLLALRCLAVLLAALAMSLPFVPGDSLLAEWTGGRQEVVLVLDRSDSMGWSLGPGVTLADRAAELVRKRLLALDDERGDAVTLLTPGAEGMLPLPMGVAPSRALEWLDQGLFSPQGVADMVEVARFVRDRVRPVRQGALTVEIYTDLQRLSWAGGSESLGGLFKEALGQAGGSLRIVPVIVEGDSRPNVGVTSLSVEDSLVLAGESATFTARVRNYKKTTAVGLEGSFTQQGELRRVTSLEPIPPGEEVAVTFRTRVGEPGPLHVGFAVTGDALSFDDGASLAVNVSRRRNVLLVDGRPGGVLPLEGATGFLQLALDPGRDDVEPRFRPTVCDVQRLDEGGEDLWRFDAIVLADVGALSETTVNQLADVVGAGTPLLIFTGSQVDGVRYERELGAAGLLPAEIGPAIGDATGKGGQDYATLALADPPPSPLSLFTDPNLSLLLRVPVLRRHRLEPRENAQVLASFVDALGHVEPAMVEGRLGEGRIVLIGTTADDTWSLWPRQPAIWLPLVHEMLDWLTMHDTSATNVLVGQSPQLVFESLPVAFTLRSPSGGATVVEKPEVEHLGVGGDRHRLTLSSTPLDQVGDWELDVHLVDLENPLATLALTARPDVREGDLRPIAEASLRSQLADLDVEIGAFREEWGNDGGKGTGTGRLGHTLLWFLLVVLLGEAIFARLKEGSA